MILFFILEAL